MTQQQQLVLDEIAKETKEQDDILEEMSMVLGNLAQVAHAIKDEVDKSNQVRWLSIFQTGVRAHARRALGSVTVV